MKNYSSVNEARNFRKKLLESKTKLALDYVKKAISKTSKARQTHAPNVTTKSHAEKQLAKLEQQLTTYMTMLEGDAKQYFAQSPEQYAEMEENINKATTFAGKINAVSLNHPDYWNALKKLHEENLNLKPENNENLQQAEENELNKWLETEKNINLELVRKHPDVFERLVSDNKLVEEIQSLLKQGKIN